MRIAFYAPMKPPDDAVPSGDREMGRLLMRAIERAGHEVLLASRLRMREAVGDAAAQHRLRAAGEALAGELAAAYAADPARRPDLWLSYHLYYKAPDWTGPAVARALGIPYVVAEASVAMKRAGGAWAMPHEAVVSALRGAAAVIGLNDADREGVLPFLTAPGRWAPLKPFIETAPFAAVARRRAAQTPRDVPVLATVAMMRAGDKLASYRVLGMALERLLHLPWRLIIAGAGPAEREARAALGTVAARTEFRGRVEADALPTLLAEADLFVWPAVNEAYGMALVEAQAAGLAVVAGNGGGVPGIVADRASGLLVPPADDAAFAAAVAALLADPARLRRMGKAAAAHALLHHDIDAASRRLDAILRAAASGARP